MTSVRATNSDQGDAPSVGTRDGSARLSLKPKGSARGALDGAWWPQSTDPAIELTALIEAVEVPVRRIALNMAGWDSTPRRIQHGSAQKAAVDWFRISGVHLVRIVGTDDQRIDLLLIPAVSGSVGEPSGGSQSIPRHTTMAPRTAMPTTGPGQLLQRRRPTRTD